MRLIIARWSFCLLLVLGTFCASAQDTDNLSINRPKPAPKVGMTKKEVAQRYGQPFHRTAASGGEEWVYRLKFDEVYGRAIVPFFIDSDDVRLGTIAFGSDDRVKSYVWQRASLRL